jgi:CcmD family protein
MQDFFSNNSIYIVLMIVLLIWGGIALYLVYLDRRTSKLEKHVENHKSDTENE